MPIFEYVCEDCGSKFEQLIRNGASAACPTCGPNAKLRTEHSTFAAKVSSGGSASRSEMPSCPGGMCATPGVCGRN
ncbi:MAG: zinc ribbon domain-containing protein [Bryobacteraceae bacterium]